MQPSGQPNQQAASSSPSAATSTDRPLPQASPPPEDKDLSPATPEQTRQELKQAIAGSNEVLAAASTFVPIFADTLCLDRAKLTLTKRMFVSTAQVMSIRIEDILNVTATIGPLFGSISITSRVFNNQKPYTINYFWRKDALRLKRITQGYVIALQRGIDCSNLPIQELSQLLDQLGEDDHPAASA
jgi:hypothetical protein